MMTPSAELKHVITNSLNAFNGITEEAWSHKPAPDKWSKREILGHLADSALNNLRRFIVTQHLQNQNIVYYQNEWVLHQNYQNTPTQEVIELWKVLNLHICRVLDNMPAEKLSYTCDTGKQGQELHTLEFLIADYIDHLKHHLSQIQ